MKLCTLSDSGIGLTRAILPLPKGRFDKDKISTAFIGRVGDKEVPTQARWIARHPDGTVSLAEVCALMPDGADSVDIYMGPQADAAADLFPLQDSVAILWRGFGIVVHGARFPSGEKRDVRLGLGSVAYERDPRIGPAVRTREVTYEHPGHLSATLQTTVIAGSEVVGLDLLLHNARSFPQLGDLYFDSVSILTPPGWELEHAWPEPAAGAPVPFGRLTAHPIIAPNPDGKPHVMLQRQRREWRITLHQGRQAEAAEWHSTLLGLDNPAEGKIAWTTDTPFGPSGAPLPDQHAHLTTRSFWELWSAFQSSSPIGQGWSAAGRLGPYHPWGPEYGGSTGGTEILQFDGPQMLHSHFEAIAAQMFQRAITDRHHVGLYTASGAPENLDNYTGWSLFSGGFQKSAEGPFKFSTADQSVRLAVQAAGLEPGYAAQLRRFAAIDGEHLARRIAHLTGLVWATGDLMAQRELMMVAELAKGEWRTLAGTVPNIGKGSGLAGRRFGWACAAVAAAYALGDDNLRARYSGWIDRAYGHMVDAQMANGWFQADLTLKPYQILNPTGTPLAERVAAGQCIELGIANHGFRCVSYVRGMVLPFSAVRAALAVARFMKPGGSGPYGIVAVRPADPALPVFMSPAESGKFVSQTDNFQIGSALAWGLLEGNPTPEEKGEILAAVRQMLGVTTDALALAKIRSSSRLYADSWFPLIRALEREVEA